MFEQSGNGVSTHSLLLWALGCWVCRAESLGSDCASRSNLRGANSATLLLPLVLWCVGLELAAFNSRLRKREREMVACMWISTQLCFFKQIHQKPLCLCRRKCSLMFPILNSSVSHTGNARGVQFSINREYMEPLNTWACWGAHSVPGPCSHTRNNWGHWVEAQNRKDRGRTTEMTFWESGVCSLQLRPAPIAWKPKHETSKPAVQWFRYLHPAAPKSLGSRVTPACLWAVDNWQNVFSTYV